MSDTLDTPVEPTSTSTWEELAGRRIAEAQAEEQARRFEKELLLYLQTPRTAQAVAMTFGMDTLAEARAALAHPLVVKNGPIYRLRTFAAVSPIWRHLFLS